MCGMPVDFGYVIADEQPSVIFAVTYILAETFSIPQHCLTSTDSSDGLIAACSTRTETPLIAVFDPTRLDGHNPLALIKALIEANPALRVLLYSAEESAFLARSAISAGAYGYVLKTSPLSSLVDGITAVSRGTTYVESRVSSDRAAQHPWSKLTQSEKRVLLAFARGESAADIEKATGRSYSTITTHKYNGLLKLGLRNGADLLPYIQANGLSHELDS